MFRFRASGLPFRIVYCQPCFLWFGVRGRFLGTGVEGHRTLNPKP